MEGDNAFDEEGAHFDYDAEDSERRKDPVVDAEVRKLARKIHLEAVTNPKASLVMSDRTNPWMQRRHKMHPDPQKPIMTHLPNTITRTNSHPEMPKPLQSEADAAEMAARKAREVTPLRFGSPS